MQDLFLLKLLEAMSPFGSTKAKSNHASGFTLIEFLVVVVIIGILSAIAAPAWLGFINRQKLSAAQDIVFTTIRNAQSEAKRDKAPATVRFGLGSNWVAGNRAQAQYFDSTVRIEAVERLVERNSSGTVTNRTNITPQEINFNSRGGISPDSVEFQVRIGSTQLGAKTCVSIKTLLGAVVTGTCS